MLLLDYPGRTHRSNQVTAPEYVFLISELAGEQRFASIVAKRLESLVRLFQEVCSFIWEKTTWISVFLKFDLITKVCLNREPSPMVTEGLQKLETSADSILTTRWWFFFCLKAHAVVLIPQMTCWGRISSNSCEVFYFSLYYFLIGGLFLRHPVNILISVCKAVWNTNVCKLLLLHLLTIQVLSKWYVSSQSQLKDEFGNSN